MWEVLEYPVIVANGSIVVEVDKFVAELKLIVVASQELFDVVVMEDLTLVVVVKTWTSSTGPGIGMLLAHWQWVEYNY